MEAHRQTDTDRETEGMLERERHERDTTERAERERFEVAGRPFMCST